MERNVSFYSFLRFVVNIGVYIIINLLQQKKRNKLRKQILVIIKYIILMCTVSKEGIGYFPKIGQNLKK